MIVREVTVLAEGTPSGDALEVIKSKKEDNIVILNKDGDFVSGWRGQCRVRGTVGSHGMMMLQCAWYGQHGRHIIVG